MRRKRHVEHSNELWPVLEGAPPPKKTKKKKKKNTEPQKDGESMGTEKNEEPKNGVPEESSQVVAQGAKRDPQGVEAKAQDND